MNSEELDAYIVWCSIGNETHFINSWLETYDALRERDSLNSQDDVAHYYVTYMGVIL